MSASRFLCFSFAGGFFATALFAIVAQSLFVGVLSGLATALLIGIGLLPRQHRSSDALAHAIAVIEGYQMDIRNLELPAGAIHRCGLVGMTERNEIYIDPFLVGHKLSAPTLAEAGFCQGSSYLLAVEDIKTIAAKEGLRP